MRTSVVTGKRLLIFDCRLLIEKPIPRLAPINNQKSSINKSRRAVSASPAIRSSMP
jgi:hypothetical protein